MKAVIFDNMQISREGSDLFGWYGVFDSAVSNSGKPFYVPDGDKDVTASFAPVIKISRLGKSVAEKFAKRYYCEIAPAIHFRIPELWKELILNKMPVDAAVNFDKSLIIGDFVHLEEVDFVSLPLVYELNGIIRSQCNIRELLEEIPMLISGFSKTNTVKMGDIICPRLFGESSVKIGDRIEVKSGEETVLTVKIK